MGEFTNEGFIQGIERSSKSLYNAMDSVYGSLASNTEKSLTASGTNTASSSSTVDNSKSYAPTINVYTQESPEKVIHRELRKMAFLI